MEPRFMNAGGSGQWVGNHAGNHALTGLSAHSGDDNSKGQALHIGVWLQVHFLCDVPDLSDRQWILEQVVFVLFLE
jgi:hypothetical protein